MIRGRLRGISPPPPHTHSNRYSEKLTFIGPQGGGSANNRFSGLWALMILPPPPSAQPRVDVVQSRVLEFLVSSRTFSIRDREISISKVYPDLASSNVSWHDLVALQILPANFPRAISSSLVSEGGAAARVASLSTKAEGQFAALKDAFADVLSNTLKPNPIKAPPMKIRLKPGAVPKKIIYTKQIPLHLDAAAEKLKASLLEAGVIAKYNEPSDWCAPGFYRLLQALSRSGDFAALQSQNEKAHSTFRG